MKKVIFSTMIVILLAAGLPCVAESPSVLLEKGIYNEETKGDLDAAMKIYKQILADNAANRKYAAEAQYRLGVCLMKQDKKPEAVECFKKLIADFPGQKQYVAQAEKSIAECRKNIGGKALMRIVENAVKTISTCSESDPRVKEALSSLAGLNGQEAAGYLVEFLKSGTPEIRRSAIYILWHGNLKDITPAVPELMKLCNSKEDFTRGMAALALGGNKVESSFEMISKMAQEDNSAYARRCAVYALGLLGNPAARPILEKAMKDSNELVSSNAGAAMAMFKAPEKKPNSDDDIKGTVIKSTLQLSHDDDKFIGMQSFGGTGEGVKFQVPGDGYKLTGVSFYGMRYGEYQPPKENFDVILCDGEYKVLKKFPFPYSTFDQRGDAKWVDLPVELTDLPKDFVIFLNFRAHQTKGVYVYYSALKGKNSLVGLPGHIMENFTKGNWMIRVNVRPPESNEKTPAAATAE